MLPRDLACELGREIACEHGNDELPPRIILGAGRSKRRAERCILAEVWHDGRHERRIREGPRLGEFFGQRLARGHDIGEHVGRKLLAVAQLRQRHTAAQVAFPPVRPFLVLARPFPSPNSLEPLAITSAEGRVHRVLRHDIRPGDGIFRLDLRRAAPEEMRDFDGVRKRSVRPRFFRLRPAADLVIALREAHMTAAHERAADDDFLPVNRHAVAVERLREQETLRRRAMLPARRIETPMDAPHVIFRQLLEHGAAGRTARRYEEFVGIERHDEIRLLHIGRLPEQVRHDVGLLICGRPDVLDDEWEAFVAQFFKNFARLIRALVVGDDQEVGKAERMAHEALDDIHLVLHHRDGDNLARFRATDARCRRRRRAFIEPQVRGRQDFAQAAMLAFRKMEEREERFRHADMVRTEVPREEAAAQRLFQSPLHEIPQCILGQIEPRHAPEIHEILDLQAPDRRLLRIRRQSPSEDRERFAARTAPQGRINAVDRKRLVRLPAKLQIILPKRIHVREFHARKIIALGLDELAPEAMLDTERPGMAAERPPAPLHAAEDMLQVVLHGKRERRADIGHAERLIAHAACSEEGVLAGEKSILQHRTLPEPVCMLLEHAQAGGRTPEREAAIADARAEEMPERDIAADGRADVVISHRAEFLQAVGKDKGIRLIDEDEVIIEEPPIEILLQEQDAVRRRALEKFIGKALDGKAPAELAIIERERFRRHKDFWICPEHLLKLRERDLVRAGQRLPIDRHDNGSLLFLLVHDLVPSRAF